jgi:hypothetical protein
MLDDEEMGAAALEWYRSTEGDPPAWVSAKTFEQFEGNTVTWSVNDSEGEDADIMEGEAGS